MCYPGLCGTENLEEKKLNIFSHFSLSPCTPLPVLHWIWQHCKELSPGETRFSGRHPMGKIECSTDVLVLACSMVSHVTMWKKQTTPKTFIWMFLYWLHDHHLYYGHLMTLRSEVVCSQRVHICHNSLCWILEANSVGKNCHWEETRLASYR